MGRAKAWAMEQAAQGFDSKDTRVCSRCVDEYALRGFIKKTGEPGHLCSYCDAEAQGEKSVAFYDFIRRVLKGMETEWGDPNDEGVGWEHGWVGDVRDTYDLLTEELDIGFRTDGLFKDALSSLSDRQWCQRNFYELKPHQALSAGWNEFTRVVKHESRYVFFRREDPRAEGRGSEEIPPSYFLDALSSVISRCGLYTKLNAGTTVLRLRVHELGKKFTKAHELGPPPPTLAKYPNRMSAAGISAFYGAFDRETTIAETTNSMNEPKSATLGHFKVLKDLYLIDFTKLPSIPSIFESASRARRHGIYFLRSFLEDFAAPTEKDGREHIEYVPTQVVSEYLRFIHRGPKNQPINGILYKSSRQAGTNACVLFIGPDGVCDPGNEGGKNVLMLESVETFELPEN